MLQRNNVNAHENAIMAEDMDVREITTAEGG